MTLREVFTELRRRDELAFVPYQTAGFPTLEQSLDNVQALCRHGADIVEIGIPFSDPIADGPTIQYASQVALDNGTRLADVLAALTQRRFDRPLVMMSYVNPLLAYGPDRLLADMRRAGFSGLIVPDLALDQAAQWTKQARAHDISLIFLLAPTSTDQRIAQVAELSDAFIYAVSLTGTTGAREALPEGLPAFLQRIRRHTDLPVVVGFGISRPEHVRALRPLADGVVVASRIIDALRRKEPWLPLVEQLKAATKPQ